MAGKIKDNLEQLGITLPQPAAPAANYVPFVISGSHLFTSGQLPLQDGQLEKKGVLGDLSLEEGQSAARLCAINVLAQTQSALADLEKIQRLTKLTVFVASRPDFTDQHLVANGASDLMAMVLGEKGIHARSAVGVACLPMNAPVEVEAIFEIAS